MSVWIFFNLFDHQGNNTSDLWPEIRPSLVSKMLKHFFQYLNTDANGVVTATHTTPVKKFVDDLTFTFKGDQTTCTVDVSKAIKTLGQINEGHK